VNGQAHFRTADLSSRENSADHLEVRAGQLSAGVLEMSNVDLATEFTNMIVAQRGFQANSKVITTSDEILQDLVNLKH
jgi:flagellar hook protein FlgE